MLHTACNVFSAVGKQWLALVDRFSGYAWTTALRRELVQRLWLAHAHLDRQRPAIPIRIQGILRSTRHTARALFPIQSRKQRTRRSSSEKSQEHPVTLHGERRKHTARYSSLTKHEPPRWKLSSTALLRATTVAWPASPD